MPLIDSLKFVQGAVAKKSPVPVLTHFSIKNNRVKGYNGSITLCSPIDLPLDCQPKGEFFVRAIQACQDTVHLAMTAAGKLTVKSGKFRAHVECSTENFPDLEPAGQTYPLAPGLVEAMKVVEPFIAEDASRAWARSVLIKDGCLMATNNVVIVQYYTGIQTPAPICISHAAVNELLRIKDDPVSVQVDGENSISFHYPDGRWLRTQAVVQPWPDVDRVLNSPANPVGIPEGFYEAIDTVAPFAEKTNDCWFSERGVTTSREDGAGATVEVEGLYPVGWYDLKMLRMLDGVASSADFTSYPKPVLFFGKEGFLRGAIIGRKDANYPPT